MVDWGSGGSRVGSCYAADCCQTPDCGASAGKLAKLCCEDDATINVCNAAFGMAHTLLMGAHNATHNVFVHGLCTVSALLAVTNCWCSVFVQSNVSGSMAEQLAVTSTC